MTDLDNSQRIALTLNLSPELAMRLKAAADLQQRRASDLVIDLLDKHLPRPQGSAGRKGKIPYT